MLGKQYSQNELDYLIKNYPHKRTDKIASKLNRSIYSIYNKHFN